MGIVETIAELRQKTPQTKVQVVRGVGVKLTENGIPVVSLHYSADPERDPEINPDWKTIARKKYSSQAAWDREQEIVDEAGGGELVFAETLRTYWNKIVITDPAWTPDPAWAVMGGFDHGKTNPTAVERCYVDFDGNKYLCGEYYVPGKNVWQHAPEILKMPDLDKMRPCWTDPSVFDQKTQQEKGKEARAVGDLYAEEGVHVLARFGGNRNDQTFAERVLAHWQNLEEESPKLYIVCRNYSDKPQPGLHPWDCPNLLWELMRTRRKKLTAQQLLTQNPTEEIIDKDNHARDCAKYIIMSLPEPTAVPRQRRIQEAMKPHIEAQDLTNAHLARERVLKEIAKEEEPMIFGGSARARLQKFNRYRNNY